MPIAQTIDSLGIIGRFLYDRFIGGIDGFGRFAMFCWDAFLWTFAGVSLWAKPRILIPLLYEIGTRSIPVILIVGTFIGMVLSVESFKQFQIMGIETRIGGIINISVVRQVGPVLAAVMLAGRIGCSISAELGTMRVTEQLDALRVMGTHPIGYLVVPRVLACLLMIPILTIFGDIMGIFGGYFWNVLVMGVNSYDYWEFSRLFVSKYDVMTGLSKSVIFGGMIGLISCYKGFHCEAGAAGVGKAATESFVMSFIAIILTNTVMAKFLQDLYIFIWGTGGFTALG
jgi:phospholipid/cholesterol/gamma-HCH transport system permease protein